MDEKPDWKTNGIRIVRSGELGTNTPQTRGMTRAEAWGGARCVALAERRNASVIEASRASEGAVLRWHRQECLCY